MLFNTLQFVLFLLLTFGIYRGLHRWRGPRNAWLLLASYTFYAGWNPWYLLLLLASTVLDYQVGVWLGRTETTSRRRLLLLTSLTGNLGLLFFFKYGNFVLENAEAITTWVGHPVNLPRIPGVLPVGVSFYTFQTLSYAIDVYWRRLPPAKSPYEFALFVAFFPQLVAGPIVRASEFLPQFDRPPRLDPQALGEGLAFMVVGLGKKMILADSIAHHLVVPFFDHPERYGAVEATLAVWGAWFGLYCDFSGYSDVAVGAALLFGFQIPKNFDRPGLSTSPLEHWRRWHITLQTWLRDYLYTPLGGSGRGPARTFFNICAVFLVGGVWHGAGWTYLWMGLYNGVLAALWYRFLPSRPRGLAAVGWGLLSFHLVAASMVFMRPQSMEAALKDLDALIRFNQWEGAGVNPQGYLWLGVAMLLHLTPRSWKTRLVEGMGTAPALGVAAVVVIAGGVCSLFSDIADPFIYFQF